MGRAGEFQNPPLHQAVGAPGKLKQFDHRARSVGVSAGTRQVILGESPMKVSHRVQPLWLLEKREATPYERGPSNLYILCWRAPLRGALLTPITQFQVFLHLAAFVTVLFCFFGTVENFAEGIFRIADYFSDQV